MTTNNYTDFANAEKYAQYYDAVISLGHIILNEKFMSPGAKFLHLNFEDVSSFVLENNPTLQNIAPTGNDIKQLVEFIRGLKPTDKLLVHCIAGYSRSAAVISIALQERDGLTEEQTREVLSSLRIPDQSGCDPNDLMLKFYTGLKNSA